MLVGESALAEGDVIQAQTVVSNMGGEPDVAVTLTLSPGGAARFEAITHEWTKRRLAILIDDEITSAPLVQTAIRGGQVRISMGVGDSEKKIAEAKRLARALGGR